MTRSPWLYLWLILGFSFLYAPIIILVLYSFNAAKSVAIWSGWSLHWYAELWHNQKIMSAVTQSLIVAGTTATLAIIFGTLAGLVLARFNVFRGRALFGALVAAPLVMPEVIIGIALLLLFVTTEQWLGWPEGRGTLTIILAHTTFAMAYVAVVVQSRLVGLDISLEEAAMDLGARPSTIFFSITLPLIAPAIISGWFLAFTLSLDDLVIASFVSGPGSTTLPMVIYSAVRLGISPEINALATIMLVCVVLAIGLSSWLMPRGPAKA